MIHYLKHSEINKSLWDECISSSPEGLIYASSWYLDCVSPGWDALVEENYAFVFPLTQRKKWGVPYLFQPFFTQQLGVFGKSENVSEKKVNEFINKIPAPFKLVEIQLNHFNVINSQNNFSVSQRLTHHLDLSASYGQLKEHYSTNTKRNIQKSVKSSIQISDKVTGNDIIKLFRQNKGREIKNLKEKDYDVLSLLLDTAFVHKAMETKAAFDSSGNMLAGAIFLHSFHSYIFLFSATKPEAKDTGSMSALIDSFIREHSGKNKYLDFEGSMDVNLARFYKSFGSKEVVYLQIRKNTLPPLIRLLK